MNSSNFNRSRVQQRLFSGRVLSSCLGLLAGVLLVQPGFANVPKWFYGALNDHIADAEARLANIESNLQSQQAFVDSYSEFIDVVSPKPQEVPELRITGANLQIVAGDNGEAIASGNLIIGYDEYAAKGQTPANSKLGRETLVLGVGNDYSGAHGLVSGRANSIRMDSAGFDESTAKIIIAGENNTGTKLVAGSGNFKTKNYLHYSLGGVNNFSNSDSSEIAIGGRNHTSVSSGDHKFVGGNSNTVSQFSQFAHSFIGGENSNVGQPNQTTDLPMNVIGGTDHTTGRSLGNLLNSPPANAFTFLGGKNNRSEDQVRGSVLLGGQQNLIKDAEHSVISGGRLNTVGNSNSNAIDAMSISGGNTRTVTGEDDWRAGGLFQDN